MFAVAALIAGLIRGGSLDALASTKFRWIAFLIVGLAIQIGYDLFNLDDKITQSRALLIVVLSFLMVATFLALNSRLPGMLLATIGLAMNIVVITANGAMPVGDAAIRISGADAATAEFGLKHERLDDNTILPWLGDVVPLPRVKQVISVGDVVLAIGIGWLIYSRTTARDRPSRLARSKSRRASSGG